MAPANRAHTGGCLCGAVRYTLSRRHLGAFNCYCGMCRKAHGGACSTHVPARRDQFELHSGTLQSYASSATGRREFCPACGTHILVHGQTADGSIAIPAGTLDGDPPVEVLAHIFCSDTVAWHEITDGLPRHATWPPGVSLPKGNGG